MATATSSAQRVQLSPLQNVAQDARDMGAASAAERLEWLDALVDRGTQAQKDALASSDLYQLLDVNGVVENLKVRDATPLWLSILEWFRNILVLVPLVLTWWGISEAVNAYQNLLDARHDLFQTSFIYLWQRGFEGYLTNGPKLSTLAIADAIILIVLILLTMGVTGRAHVYNNHKERKAEELRANIAKVLAQIKLSLATAPSNIQQPTNFVSYFDQTSRNLLGAIQQERDVLNRLLAQGQQNQQQQGQLAQALSQLMQEMQRTMQSFQQTGQTFGQATQTLQQATQGLQQTAQTFQQTGQQISTSVANLAQMVKDLTAEQARLVAIGGGVVTGLQMMLTKQDTLLDKQSQMVAEQGKILPGLDALRQGVEQSIVKLEQDVRGLGQRADNVIVSLDIAGKEIVNLVQRIDALSTHQEGYVDALKQMQQDQQMMITNMAGLAGSVANAVNQLPTLQAAIQGVWTEANNTVRLLGAVPTTVQKGLDSLLSAHQLAASDLTMGSRTLKDASTEFRTGVDQLRRYFP